MSSLKKTCLFAGLSLFGHISRVIAHGYVTGIVIEGRYYRGFNPGALPGQHPRPQNVIAWANDAIDTGFVAPHSYKTPDIVCHQRATPAPRHAPVNAGSTVELQWNQFHPSHHGPIVNYMARCPERCEKADKTKLKFFKVSQTGLEHTSPYPGVWATDDMRNRNLSWTVTVPPTLAAGHYVLRHELIALHGADKPDGAQNYPQCINLRVIGSGTDNPPGIPATQFYKPADPGISLSIWWPIVKKYTIPGPPVWKKPKASQQSHIRSPEPKAEPLVPWLKKAWKEVLARKVGMRHPRDLTM